MLTDDSNGDLLLHTPIEPKMLGSTGHDGCCENNGLVQSSPLRSTNSLDRLCRGEWSEFPQDLTPSVIDDSVYESILNFSPYNPAKTDSSSAQSYPMNGVNFSQSDSDRSCSSFGNGGSDLLFSSQGMSSKRHCSLEHLPTSMPTRLSYGLMNGRERFLNDKYSSSFISQDSGSRQNGGQQILCDHQKLYFNYLNSLSPAVEKMQACMNLEKVFYPQNQRFGDSNSGVVMNSQTMDWYMNEKQHSVSSEDWMVSPNWPVYRSRSCPSQVYSNNSLPPTDPYHVLSGKPIEGMDESEGDFFLSSHGKRRTNKKRENLPKESTALLKKWLLKHMLMPYPINEEKMALCHATGLDISQINNWFINARVRIWKPMVIKIFKKYKSQLEKEAKTQGDENLFKRISDADKSTTMSMISLLSSCVEARKELEDMGGNDSTSL